MLASTPTNVSQNPDFHQAALRISVSMGAQYYKCTKQIPGMSLLQLEAIPRFRTQTTIPGQDRSFWTARGYD
jgi:hypothetical protein